MSDIYRSPEVKRYNYSYCTNERMNAFRQIPFETCSEQYLPWPPVSAVSEGRTKWANSGIAFDTNYAHYRYVYSRFVLSRSPCKNDGVDSSSALIKPAVLLPVLYSLLTGPNAVSIVHASHES